MKRKKSKREKKTSGGLRAHVKEDDGGLSFIHLYLFFFFLCVLLLFVRRGEPSGEIRRERGKKKRTGETRTTRRTN